MDTPRAPVMRWLAGKAPTGGSLGAALTHVYVIAIAKGDAKLIKAWLGAEIDRLPKSLRFVNDALRDGLFSGGATHRHGGRARPSWPDAGNTFLSYRQ